MKLSELKRDSSRALFAGRDDGYCDVTCREIIGNNNRARKIYLLCCVTTTCWEEKTSAFVCLLCSPPPSIISILMLLLLSSLSALLVLVVRRAIEPWQLAQLSMASGGEIGRVERWWRWREEWINNRSFCIKVLEPSSFFLHHL